MDEGSMSENEAASQGVCEQCGLPRPACETIEHQRKAIEAFTSATRFLPPVAEGVRLVTTAQDHMRAADEAYRQLLAALAKQEHF
jgi:hypothetical protein